MKIKQLLCLAILLRILVMPFYFHPDIKTTFYQVSFLERGATNIYSYIFDNRPSLTIKDDFTYFPLTYFSLGAYEALVSPLLGPNFQSWLSGASASTVTLPDLFRYLFVLKLPLLIFDLATAFLLLKAFKDPEKGRQAFIFWLFNPFSIVLIYAFSNIDIFVAFLTFVSWLYASRNQFVRASLFLGLAAGFKLYPLMFLPILMIYGRSTLERVKIITISLVAVAIPLIPYIGSTDFRGMALVSGLTTRLLFPGLNIGFGETIMLSMVALSGLFFYLLMTQHDEDRPPLYIYYLGILLFVFSFIHFHVSWLLWMFPFLTLLVVNNPKFKLPVMVLLLVAMLIPVLYDDKFMSVSLLSGISPLYSLIPTPFAILQKFFDPFLIESGLHSALAGASLVLVFQMIRLAKK